MKKVIASAGLLALGAVGVFSARADWAAGPDKPWTISGTLRGFYDDNYNTAPDNTFGRKSSTGFEVSPKASFAYSDGPTSITTSYAYSEKYYDSRPGNKSDQSHDFEFILNHAFNERYKMDLDESFVDSQEPEVLSGGGPVSLPVRANGDNFRNSVALNGNAQFTRLFGMVLGYANTFYDYTGRSPGAGVVSYGTSLNRFEHQLTLNSRWTIDPETVGIFGYQFNYIDYISHGSLQPGGPFESPSVRDNYTHNIYVGVEHSFTPQLTFSGRAGIQISDYYNQDKVPGQHNTSDVGPFADLSFSYNYMENGSLTLGFRQSKNSTDVAANPDGSLTQDEESSTVYAAVNQTLTPISPDLSVSLNGQYQNSVYNGGTVFNNENDSYYLLGLNITYQFTHYVSGEVGYNYDLLQSDIAGRGYNRNRVYIGVTASY